jgi:raffinose/stachyose/melibiose transport system substrate-binding protein
MKRFTFCSHIQGGTVLKHRGVRPKLLATIATAGALALTLAACSGGSGSSSSANAPKSFSFLAINENTTIPSVLTSLSKNQCSAENKALPLKINKTAQAGLDQQLQLLAGQKALPVAFVSPGSPQLTQKLYTTKAIVNFANESDVKSQIVGAASTAIKALYKGDTIVLPTELNIEGIWYNKKLLSQNGISVPTSWTSLESAFAKLKSAGVQPISNAGNGGDGWGITRWVGAYIFRDLGPNAMVQVANGKAKLTDPQYVKAANVVSAMGKDGYFGPSPQSVNYATALNTFQEGKAGFIYMGSWAVSNFDAPTAGQIPASDIGFLPFPNVPGGKGNSNQLPSNVGTTISVNATAYNSSADVRNWVKCIADNYGAVALKSAGQVTGFKVPSTIKVSPLTKLVQTQIKNSKTSVAWFEALFPAGATTTSQDNGGLLGSGQSSGTTFMQTVQASLTNG